MKTKPSFTVNKLSLAIISVISAATLLTTTPRILARTRACS
nr:hypothetical protein [Shewanella vesiculosa]